MAALGSARSHTPATSRKGETVRADQPISRPGRVTHAEPSPCRRQEMHARSIAPGEDDPNRPVRWSFPIEPGTRHAHTYGTIRARRRIRRHPTRTTDIFALRGAIGAE